MQSIQPEQPLKINFLVDSIGKVGTYFRFHNLALGLTKLGHEVNVFACDENHHAEARTEIRDRIPYHIVPSFPGKGFFTSSHHPITALRRSLISYPDCDVVHMFQPMLNVALPWQTIFKKKAKLRFYDWDDLYMGGLVSHATPPTFVGRWRKYWSNQIENKFPAQADHVTTCSHFLAERSEQLQAKDVTIIHNGFWGFDILDRATARKNFGLEPDAIYVGFMGRTFDPSDSTFQAIANNLEKYPNLRFAVCGITTEILAKMNIWQHVPEAVKERTKMFGYISPERAREFSAAIDIGLLHLEDNEFNRSRFPIKYAEYMATGTPVLCSSVGECAMISQDFPWVIQAGTTEAEWLTAFERAIASIANGTMPKVDLDAIAVQLSWANISQKLEHTYYQALNKKFPMLGKS